MTFNEAISACFKKYATFDGRAARSEFWWFYLFCFIVSVLAQIVDGGFSGAESGLLNFLVSLALFLPLLAAGARRLHDIGRTGWWQLLSLTVVGIFVLIFWWTRPGETGANSYGAPASSGASPES